MKSGGVSISYSSWPKVLQEEEDIREGRGKRRADKAIVPIILAAGQSKRFGSPKSLVNLKGKYLVTRAIENCKKAGLSEPVIVLGYKANLVAKKGGLGTFIVNKSWKKGQLSSLKCGLKALPERAAAFLIYPVDYPLVTQIEIKRLIAARKRYRIQKIFRPSYRGRAGHPVLVDISLRREFLNLPASGTARSVMNRDARRARFVTMSSNACLRNMNTKEDYQEIIRSR